MSQSKAVANTSAKGITSARKAFERGDFSKAESRLKQIITTDPQCAEAYFYLGRIAQATGHVAHAAPLFNEAIRLMPANTLFISTAAQHLALNGAKDQAIRLLRHALQRMPEQKALREQLSRLEGVADLSADTETQTAALKRLAAEESYDAVLSHAQTMLEANEGFLSARYYYGMALVYSNRLDEGIQQLNLVVSLDPSHDEAWGQLGVAYLQQYKFGESLAAHERALMLKPNEPVHHINCGSTYLEMGMLSKAEDSAKAALSLKGDAIGAIALLARVAGKQWQYDKARVLLQQALKIKPGYKTALATLVDVMLAEGDLLATEREARKLIAVDRDMIQAYNTLIDALTGQMKHAEALAIVDLGLKRHPDQVPLLNRRGIVFNNLKRYADAIAQYRKILEEYPEYFPARLNLAGMYSLVSEHTKSMEQYAIALEAKEMKADYFSGYVFSQLYDPEASTEKILDLSKQWSSNYCADTKVYQSWNVDVERASPLRIGIVSGDFRNHPVGYFLESVLRELSSKGVEIYLYTTVLTVDETTHKFMDLADSWYKAFKDSPQVLAERIHKDQVKILIDVSGHTAHNRLMVFARKPAPVQMTWLGYLSTTGLDTVDYIVGDPWVTPEGEAHHFTEKPLPLRRTYQCLSQPDIDLDVAELPALENGFVTFGTFNNFAKLNRPVLELWAKVLLAVPDSRLLIKNQVLTDTVYQESLRAQFVELGIDASRLMFEPSRSREHILESYGRVDIGLDPFPYTGCTTTFESLWMGVPVISRKGNRFLSHAGESILNNLDMPDWVADDSEHYVQLAVEKSSDIESLARLRGQLRSQLKSSPLMDSKAFVEDFHDALSTAWQTWLDELEAVNTVVSQPTD